MQSVRSYPQSNRWCFTTNNPDPFTETYLSNLAQEETVKYLVYGREVAPTTGTPHLQGFVIFSTRLRLSAVKQKLPVGSHLEIARGTSQEASVYCKKEYDYEEHGELPGPPGKTNRYESFRDWVLEQSDKPCAAVIAREFPSIFLTSGRVDAFVDAIYPRRVDESPFTYRGYQLALGEILDAPPHPRKIIFVVDTTGNSGKSWFVKKYSNSHPDSCQVLSVGKREDLSYAIDESKSIFLFDLPRSSSEFLPYTVLEQLKDGRLFSNKYQSKMKLLHAPCAHVAVFTNEYPDMSKLSVDRFQIIDWHPDYNL